MSEPVTREDFSRSELVNAMAWLCAGAGVSVLMEVVYLDATVAGIMFPASVIVALLFNSVLTRTAMLWTRANVIALIPLAVWIAAFVVLLIVVPASRSEGIANNILTVVLLFAGVVGGVWPVIRGQ